MNPSKTVMHAVAKPVAYLNLQVALIIYSTVMALILRGSRRVVVPKTERISSRVYDRPRERLFCSLATGWTTRNIRELIYKLGEAAAGLDVTSSTPDA